MKHLLGSLIATGGTRAVFQHKGDPSLVIKLDEHGAPSQNVLEYEIWKECEKHNLPLARWLAPCADIWQHGQMLVQVKTSPVEVWPEEIPVFFSDTDKSNFGMIDGRFVCHDYAINMAWKHGFSCDMKPINWGQRGKTQWKN